MTNTICICEVIKRTPWPSTTFTATIKVNPLCPLHGTGKLPAASEGEAIHSTVVHSDAPTPENSLNAASPSQSDETSPTPTPQPASEDDEIRKLFTDYFLAGDERVEGHLIPDIQALFAQARAEGRREELELVLTQAYEHKCEMGSEWVVFAKDIHARLAQLNGEQS